MFPIERYETLIAPWMFILNRVNPPVISHGLLEPPSFSPVILSFKSIATLRYPRLIGYDPISFLIISVQAQEN